MVNKELIRTLTKSYYDAQRLRIQVGGRIVANKKSKLGNITEVDEKEVNSILDDLLLDFKRLTDVMASKTYASKVKILEKSDGVISDIFEYELISYYNNLLVSEKDIEKTILRALSTEDIYNSFLKGVKGCGTLMSAVLLSEFDITKARHSSSFHKYAGLDVVLDKDGVGKGRSRRKEHLEPRSYVDKTGNIKETVGISFNPFLKTKLIGVLGSSFLKCRSPYRDVYDNYKNRLNQRNEDLTPGHIHYMSIRYMIKMFLIDFWLEWRRLEGLPVTRPYHEAKLGLVHGQPYGEII